MSEESITLHDRTFERFIGQSQLEEVLSDMAKAINETYAGKEVVILGVLDGVIVVLAGLITRLNLDMEIELVKLKSYVGTTSSGHVKTLLGIQKELSGKHILVVEDIIDTGNTLSYLMEELAQHQVASVRIATLLIKEDIFKNKFEVHFKGIAIPNRFVVGFGMDYDGKGRQLPEIYAAIE